MATSVSRQAIEPRASRKPDTDVNILLVDDDPGAIQLMGRILADVGKLRFATNGKDALRLARDAAEQYVYSSAQQIWGKGLHPNLQDSMFYL